MGNVKVPQSKLSDRDVARLARGLAYFYEQEKGTPAPCAVCGCPTSMYDVRAKTGAFTSQDRLHGVVLCKDHIHVEHPSEYSHGPHTWFSLDGLSLNAAASSLIMEHISRAGEQRYFIIHEFDYAKSPSFGAADAVLVIDADAENPVLGVIPAPLKQDETDDPFFTCGGEFASQCVELIDSVRRGKAKFTVLGGSCVVSMDELPKHIPNIRLRSESAPAITD